METESKPPLVDNFLAPQASTTPQPLSQSKNSASFFKTIFGGGKKSQKEPEVKKDFFSDVDAAPSIPTLEQEQEEALTRQVAEAPDSLGSFKVQSLTELDNALQFLSIADKMNEGIDLGILTSVLSKPSQIQEVDELWGEQMFRDLLHSCSNPSSSKQD